VIEIEDFLREAGIDQWGVAVCPDPPWRYAPSLPRAVSIGMRLDPDVMEPVKNGPTSEYFQEYRRVNVGLRGAACGLAAFLAGAGAAAVAVQPTGSPDPSVTDWSDARVFAHKTAAT